MRVTSGTTTLYYFLTDHLGSVVGVVDADGNLVSQQHYYPFGGVRNDLGSINQTDFGYTGQRSLDAQGNSYVLGLMDYKARFFDESLGRFTQPDSMAPGGSQGLNRYSYTSNNPVNAIDPTGHACKYHDYAGHSVPYDCTPDTYLSDIGDSVEPKSSNDSNTNAVDTIIGVLQSVGLVTNQKISSPVPINIYTSDNYELMGGISVTARPFVASNNNKQTILGTNEITKAVNVGPLSMRGSVNSEMTPSFGIFTTGVDNAMKQTLGVSAPILLDPREASFNATYSVGLANSPASFGSSFTFSARINPTGFIASWVAVGTSAIPEITIPSMYTICRASGAC